VQINKSVCLQNFLTLRGRGNMTSTKIIQGHYKKENSFSGSIEYEELLKVIPLPEAENFIEK
jgi:hypothetical protein